MENFLDILTNLGVFLNSYWFPLLLALICILFFAVMFFRANRMVDKHRQEIKKKIINEAYEEQAKKQQKK